MFDKLNILKHKGYSPDIILDIGAYHGKWTLNMKQIYDKCKYYLFEAIDYPELKLFTDKVFIVILNRTNEKVDWYQMKNTGDSMFREKTHFFRDCEILKRQSYTLDTLLANDPIHDFKHIFIKIDCQGSEIPILKGAKSLLNNTDFILLEIPLFGQYNEGVPDFLEHIKFMDSIDFIPYDIVEDHYYKGFNMQIDMLFINKKHKFNEIVKIIS